MLNELLFPACVAGSSPAGMVNKSILYFVWRKMRQRRCAVIAILTTH